MGGGDEESGENERFATGKMTFKSVKGKECFLHCVVNNLQCLPVFNKATR